LLTEDDVHRLLILHRERLHRQRFTNASRNSRRSPGNKGGRHREPQ
jgi:hypothetical protein